MDTMRSIWRTPRLFALRDDPDVAVRDIAVVCLADALVGASLGAIAVASDLPWWLPCLLSIAVFAGASQFVFVGVLTGGGSVLAAVSSALLINGRLLPLSFSVAPLLGERPATRLLGAHLVTDESVAFSMASTTRRGRTLSFWFCGAFLFLAWNLGVLAGVGLGAGVESAESLGLDAAFPAVLLALVMPSLRDRVTRIAAGIGAVVAVAAGLVVPAGVSVVLALIAVMPFVVRHGRRNDAS
ncbi:MULTISPECIES: AzlC family ABC transporter permease [unclassified Rhodococcus (in: high G+C Gram-positive bacteria)]|uniref:AzlC family ABC transporter permease n=2 Tax=unclassified Rhodococcus (in: high G+C Gram-positive bacteria) TaxID=192944 RepID=UPI0021C1BD88|nr:MULTISPECIES: AzlC family ABC transporter permease [unclassified Rhodococcus (in: high G+C Gram-positive bacteria)]